MTDETRPESTPPTPDDSTPEPKDKGASLDSWFQPRAVKEKELEGKEQPTTGETSERAEGVDQVEGVDAAAGEDVDVVEAGGGKEAAWTPEQGDSASDGGAAGAAEAQAAEAETQAEGVGERGSDANEVTQIAAGTAVAADAAVGDEEPGAAEEADQGDGDQAEASGAGAEAAAVGVGAGTRAVEDEGERADSGERGDSGEGTDEGDEQDEGEAAPAVRPGYRPNDSTQVIPAPLVEAAAAGDADDSGNDLTQVFAVTPPAPEVEPDGDGNADADDSGNDLTQVFPVTPPVPPAAPTPPAAPPAAAAPTQAIPRPGTLYPRPAAAEPDIAVRPAARGAEAWSPAPGPQPQYQEAPPAPQRPSQRERERERERQEQRQAPQYQEYQAAPPYQQAYQQPGQQRTQAYQTPGGVASILPPRGHGDYDDDFDSYSYGGDRQPRSRARRALMVTASVLVLIVAVGAALVFSGKVKVAGLNIGAKPVPTVGFSPTSTDAGSDATQTGTAFLTDWQNGNLAAAANITDNQSAALQQLTAYKNDLKVSGLTLIPGTASAQGWMTFSVTAQVGSPSSAWSYSSGMATYSSNVDGYTRWFVKWAPSLMFTSLKSGQKLTLGLIPPTANKVVDRNGTEITSANAPSLNNIVSQLKKAAPPASGTPGQEVEVVNADGSVASQVSKLSDPVALGALKTTFDMKVQAAAQAAVNQAPNSSMVVIQPSTGDILAVANNPTTGYDNAMAGHYAPGSTFKTITTTLVLNKGVITNLNQTWDCPQILQADGITLHNSEQEAGVGKSFLWDFAQSCNNAFSRFEGKVSRDELTAAAHDYYGFNQKWDVGLGVPTTYGFVPDTSSNSLAEELVGQDRIATSPLSMASVAATIANGSFKQPIMVPGTAQIPGTPIPSATDQDLKTLMHEVVVSGTLAGVFNGEAGVYAKTGTAEVAGKTANSWTVAFKGDYAVAALAIGGNYGASTAGPEVKSLLNAVG